MQHKAIREKNYKLFLSTLTESQKEQCSNLISYGFFMQLRPIRLKKVVSKEKYDDRMKIRTIEIDEEGQEFGKVYLFEKEDGKWRISYFQLE
ncbi:MAG: hypothetical protein QXL88_00635 [Candidatus Pacearchaeota archaeon]